MANSPSSRGGENQAANDVLRVVVDTNGSLKVLGEPAVEFDDFRRRPNQDPDKWLGVLNWVDAWAEEHGVVEELSLGDVSLWWFVRNAMIQRFRDLLADIEAVGALVAEASPHRLRLESANEYWRDVCQVVLTKTAIPFDVSESPYRDSPKLAARLGPALVSAVRTAVGIWRNRRLRKPANVLAVCYTAWRRVNVEGQPRYIDPAYELVLDEMEGLGLSVMKLSAPAAGSVEHQLTWLRRGDSEAVPIEYSIAKWWARSRFNPDRHSGERLRQRVRTVLSRSERSRATWKGYDVSGLVRRFLETQLSSRANRAAWLLSFFADFLERAKPRVVFLCHEYSGLAMAVCAAARRKRIPIVAVQHGVIWRAHHGYVLPREKRDTMPRADVLCVFGEYDRELVVERGVYGTDEVVVTGSPRLDLLVAGRPSIDRRQLKEQLDLPAETPLVVFTSIGEHGDLVAQRLVDSLVAAEKPPSVIVKLHPSAELGVEPYSVAAAAKGLSNLRVVREEFDLYDLFRLADVHMSVNSTSLSEAVLFDRPNIMLGTDVFSDTVGYLERNVAVAAESYPSLSAAVEDVLDGPAGERLRRGRRAFIAHQYFQLDGSASARVAAVLERFAGPN